MDTDQQKLFQPTNQPVPEAGSIEPTSPGKSRHPRIDVERIPERAWKAADYLRSQILIRSPGAVLGTKPWKPGWIWANGTAAGVKVGDGSMNGLRLSWANSFRLFQAKLAEALGNAGKIARPEDAWEEIAKTVYWLFHKQPAGVGFIVECPDTLRDKWDRIQAVRVANKTPGMSDRKPAMRVKYDEQVDSPFSQRKP